MTDKEKLEKIVAYLMRRMYAHNQMADIGSTGEVFDEKIENAKYEECKDTLNFIDSMQEEPKKCMYSKDNYTAEDRKVLCGGCEEECEFNKKEKPVSEDIWEASKQYALRQVLASTDAKMTEQAYLNLKLFSGFEIAVAHKDGANWQKQKDESKVLTEEQCRKIRDDAFELGKDAMKQQLMAKAIDGEVGYWNLRGLSINTDLPRSVSEGDKVKIIVIKED